MTTITDKDERRFSRWAIFLRFVGRLFCHTSHGLEQPIDTFGRPLVVVANHRSFFDLPVGYSLLENVGIRPRILVRDKFFDMPLIGWFLRSTGCIRAGRGWRDTINTAVETLQRGRPVGVMLEGKIVLPEMRDQDGLGKVRRGFLQIARAGNAVVLPTAIVGTDHVWPAKSRFPKIGLRNRPLVQIHIGRVVVIDDMTDREALDAVRSEIASYIRLLNLSDQQNQKH